MVSRTVFFPIKYKHVIYILYEQIEKLVENLKTRALREILQVEAVDRR